MTAEPMPQAGVEIRELRPSAGLSLTQLAVRRLRQDRLTLAAMAVLVTLGLLAILAPVISEHVIRQNPERIDLLRTFSPPNAENLLGTDENGRDQLARLLYGARVSMSIGFAAALINMTLGVVIGAVAAYYGRHIDDIITWFINTVRSIPGLFLLIMIGALFRPSVEILIIVLGLLSWPGVARLVRGQVLSVKEREFVLAARTIGAGDLRIIFAHILPNVVPLVITFAGIDIGSIILVESTISYLGLGVQPPTPSWGNMLSGSTRYFTQAPWLIIAPGALIWVTVLCLYLIADGLRDALDPRLKT